MTTSDNNFWFKSILYNSDQNRVEMHLVSLKDQWVQIDKVFLRIKQGETIHTENSYKYDFENFEKLTRDSGFQVVTRWTDPKEYFAVYMLRTTENA